jgi:glycosyltransferase 2 family protein
MKNSNHMKLIFQKSLSYFFSLIILGFVIYYFIHNWDSIKSINWWKNPGFLGSHIALVAVTFTLFVIGWHRLLIETGNDINVNVAAFTWLTSNIGKYVPGIVLMVAGRIALLNRFGTRKAAAAGNILWEHFFLILSAIPFSFLVLLNNKWNFSIYEIVATIFISLSILLVVLNPFFIQRVINFLLRLFKKPSLELVLKRKAIAYFFIFYLLVWAIYGVSGITLGYAFGFQDKVPMLFLFNVYIFSWFIGFISIITPGGLGVREGVLVLMLSKYVPTSELIVFAFFARMTWIIIEIIGVIIGVVIGNKLNTQLPKQSCKKMLIS